MLDATTERLLKLTGLLNKMFPEADCKPGVLVSFLDHRGVWYVAAHYYETRGTYKKVLAYSEHSDLLVALGRVEKKLTEKKPTEPGEIEAPPYAPETVFFDDGLDGWGWYR